ncbi:MAG TPA: hypothetical protein VMU59_07115 [Caulobacteraceae bacterium]|nr:hypothetical protein [Caulobacteraceae bacterium]
MGRAAGFWCGLALTLTPLSAGLAQGQAQAPPTPDAVPYPPSSTAQDDVQAWIGRYLPVQGYVVGAWSANVVMLVSIGGLDAHRYPLVTTKVLSEVLNAQAAAGAGWRAAEQIETFDCDHNVYQVVASLYHQRGDRQDPPEREPGDGAWRAPDPGATMDTVERAACFYGERQKPAALEAGSGAAAAAAPARSPAQARPAPKPPTVRAKPARNDKGRAKRTRHKGGKSSSRHRPGKGKTAKTGVVQHSGGGAR